MISFHKLFLFNCFYDGIIKNQKKITHKTIENTKTVFILSSADSSIFTILPSNGLMKIIHIKKCFLYVSIHQNMQLSK